VNHKDIEGKCVDACRKCEAEVHKGLGLFSKKYRDWIYEYKGYMSKEDGLLDYHEWHPAIYSILLVSLAYIVDPPINIIFMALWLQILKRLNQDSKAENNKLLKQAKSDPWYFLGHGAVLIIVFETAGLGLGFGESELAEALVKSMLGI
jgi:hypothetical protein